MDHPPDDTLEHLPDYEWWIDYKAVWDLKTAANLYLGFDPAKGGTFLDFNDFLKQGLRGFILTDAETIWHTNALNVPNPTVELHDIIDENNQSRISLESFIRGKITALGIKPLDVDGMT
jgi:hypothetical protein